MESSKKKYSFKVWVKTLLMYFPIVSITIYTLLGTKILWFHSSLSILLTITPFLFIITLLYYLVLLLIKRSRLFLILFISFLLITLIKYADSILSYNPSAPKNSTEISVMTWNVERLGELQNKKQVSQNINTTIHEIQQNNPEVIILQEVTHKQLNSIIAGLKITNASYEWSDYYGTMKNYKSGIAVLINSNSEWRIRNKNVIKLPPQWKSIYVELENNKKQHINVLGLHIAPPKITSSDIKTIGKTIVKTPKKGLSKFKHKLRSYSRQLNLQTKQVNKILSIINNFKDPTIIAGDFNSSSDLPLHIKLRKDMQDVWLESGNGFGSTRYFGGVIPLRIDYIYSTVEFTSTSAEVLPAHFSDHNPVVANFYLLK
jgi:endonuclease/exonuclease/phosphatase (EEP) superfamily protein YafD